MMEGWNCFVGDLEREESRGGEFLEFMGRVALFPRGLERMLEEVEGASGFVVVGRAWEGADVSEERSSSPFFLRLRGGITVPNT